MLGGAASSRSDSWRAKGVPLRPFSGQLLRRVAVGSDAGIGPDSGTEGGMEAGRGMLLAGALCRTRECCCKAVLTGLG